MTPPPLPQSSLTLGKRRLDSRLPLPVYSHGFRTIRPAPGRDLRDEVSHAPRAALRRLRHRDRDCVRRRLLYPTSPIENRGGRAGGRPRSRPPAAEVRLANHGPDDANRARDVCGPGRPAAADGPQTFAAPASTGPDLPPPGPKADPPTILLPPVAVPEPPKPEPVDPNDPAFQMIKNELGIKTTVLESRPLSRSSWRTPRRTWTRPSRRRSQ